MSWEKPEESKCDLCLTYTPADLLERAEVFPLELVCESCLAELNADDEGEDCECRGGCPRCLAVRGIL